MAISAIAVSALVAVPVLVREIRCRHDKRMVTSCANHAIQLKFVVLAFVEILQKEQFPSESDARAAFMRMSDGRPTRWFNSIGSACPEAFLRDRSIGYVFVAEGLPTKLAEENAALIFLCPADSHQRSEQHSHAVVGAGELMCLDNAGMIELLRREIERAGTGTVPYSSNSVAKMKRELESRQRYEKKRAPNKPVHRTGARRRHFELCWEVWTSDWLPMLQLSACR